MNNSKIALDNLTEETVTSKLLDRKGELTQIIEAINSVEASNAWQKLKKLVFDGVLETLERQLKAEAQKPEVVTPELYRLQGQLVWAKKYADLDKLGEFFKQQLDGINNQIRHDKNPSDGAL